MTGNPIAVFDGHNDVLLRLFRRGGEAERAFLDGEAAGHIDLPKARRGGLAGGLFAIFSPSDDASGGGSKVEELMATPPYDVPLPEHLELTFAQRVTVNMAALLFRIERASAGAVKVCRSAAEIRGRIGGGVLARVLHVEGADAIDPGFPPPRCPLRGRPALARARLEPAERLRPRRSVPLPVVARHRAGADRCSARALVAPATRAAS